MRARRLPTSIILAASVVLGLGACSGSDADGAGPDATATSDSANERDAPHTTEEQTTEEQPTEDAGDDPEAPEDGSSSTSTSEGVEGADAVAEGGGTPSAVWIVDGASFDIVAVDLETGEERSRIPGWGDLDGDAEAGPAQALVSIELTADRVWVDDCCEPAYGSTFGVDLPFDAELPSDALITDAASVTLGGLGPRISPDGTLVAVALGDVGVVVADASTGASVVELDVLRAQLSAPSDQELVFWSTLAWVEPRTLVVGAPTAEGTLVSFVDLTDPAAPVTLTEPLEVLGELTDATVGLDGHVVALARIEGGAEAVVIDATTGTEVSRFALLPGTIGIDASPDGQRFLLVDEAGDVVVQTADGEIEGVDLGDLTAVDAAW